MDTIDILVQQSCPDIMVLSKTWLNGSVSNKDIEVHSYNVFRGRSVAGQAQCALTKVARCTVFPPHWCTLVRLASGLEARCVKRQCGLVGLCLGGRMAFDLRLSRARTGNVAMRQDSNY